MKLELFSIPVYIDNIDCSKIKLKNVKFTKTWFSKTESSHDYVNELDEESNKYLLNKIWNLIYGDFNGLFEIKIKNIWENRYKKFDYQEAHNHPHAHFSFIVYKDIEESQTIFMNPAIDLIQPYYVDSLLDKMNILKRSFKPSCRKNQIVVFPSFLQHMVLRHSNSVSIAGNITLTLKEN